MDPNSTQIECRKAADCFLHLIPHSHEPELLQLCSDGLHEVAIHYDYYNATVTTASPFMKELAESVRLLCSDEKPAPEVQHDRAFMLMEALALVMREAILREGTQQTRPVQEAILRYFEESGHWQWDETLVADYYYIRIPIAVMHKLTSLLTSLGEGVSGQTGKVLS